MLVVYTDAAGIGGAEISLGHLVETTSKAIEIIVVGTSKNVVEAIAQRRPQAAHLVLPSSLAAHLRTFHRLKPDVVHFNLCTPWACAIGLTAALTLPKARLVRVDQLPLRTTEAIALWRTRALSLRVDAHVAVGEASARRMEDFYALGRGSVRSIPNCVPDLETPTPPQRRDTLVVGSLGRLDAMKGHDVLLKAIAQVPDVRVVILGEGSQRPELEQLAAELGISDRLDLPGWVDNPRSYLPQFDIIAHPSRSEGFPLAIVEAMLAARPVIATRVGSIPEAVIDGETGILIEKDDIQALVMALRRLQDPQLRSRFGEKGRLVAQTHFTVQHMTHRYEQLWQEIIALPKVPRWRIPQPKP